MLVVSIEEFSYGKKKIFEDIHLEIAPSSIIGLVAPNGTGKSTLVRLISGHITSESTQIRCNGKTYGKESRYMRQQIVKMPDQADLYDELTGLQHLEYYAAMWKADSGAAKKVVSLLQMENYIQKKVGTYSLGMRQRLCFALVVVTQASYMLLDEVMNGLDPDNVQLISNVLLELKKQGKTMIIASHLLDNLDTIADTVYFIKDCHFPITYYPQENKLESMLLTFVSKEELRSFWGQYEELGAVRLDDDQIIIELAEDELRITELFKWLSSHLSSVKEIKVGKKGSHLLYKELYSEHV